MELDPNSPPGQHLVAAFLAMEPSDCLISIARECGGGLVSEQVQTFIWENCINQAVIQAAIGNEPYLKKFVKKLIVEIESTHGNVLDELYEQYGCYMTSLKEESLRACKHISFLFPDGSTELSSCPESRKLVIPLNCSLNMLEGDTGLVLVLAWLEFVSLMSKLPRTLSVQVVLTDGDLSTLANMKLNLESNHIATTPSKRPQDRNLVSLVISNRQINIWVKCIHLPWESAAETELQSFTPDIVLGADVIYDPSCIPHLVRVLANLLKNGAVGYIASVIRNVDTFNCFLDVAEKAELVVSDVTDGVRPLELLPYMNSYRQNGVRLFTVTSKC
ncbi:Protein-lysine N-methyltransferase EEF2KMT [Linum grandiflorum]